MRDSGRFSGLMQQEHQALRVRPGKDSGERKQDSPIKAEAPYRGRMQNSWKNRWKLALKNSRAALGLGSTGAIMLRALTVVAIIGGLLFFGSEDASRDEIIGRMSLAILTALLFPVVLVWNLASSPYHIEKRNNRILGRKNTKLKKDISELKQRVIENRQPVPGLEITIFQMAWNGKGVATKANNEVVDSSEAFGEGVIFFLMLTIKNKGLMPSIATFKSIQVDTKGETFELHGKQINSPITIGSKGGGFKLLPKDWIVPKLNSPIPVGGVITGHLTAILPDLSELHPSDKGTIRIVIDDILGNKSETEEPLQGVGSMSYFPGTEFL
jgi:hypothetical protein